MSLHDIKPFLEQSGQLAQEIELSEQEIVGLLKPALEEREKRDQYSRRYEALKTIIRAYFEDHPEYRLYDGESEIEAWLEERSLPGGMEVDLISLRQQDPILFQRLFDCGCLTLNHKALEAQGAQVAGWKRYAMPKGKTTALRIERKR